MVALLSHAHVYVLANAEVVKVILFLFLRQFFLLFFISFRFHILLFQWRRRHLTFVCASLRRRTFCFVFRWSCSVWLIFENGFLFLSSLSLFFFALLKKRRLQSMRCTKHTSDCCKINVCSVYACAHHESIRFFSFSPASSRLVSSKMIPELKKLRNLRMFLTNLLFSLVALRFHFSHNVFSHRRTANISITSSIVYSIESTSNSIRSKQTYSSRAETSFIARGYIVASIARACTSRFIWRWDRFQPIERSLRSKCQRPWNEISWRRWIFPIAKCSTTSSTRRTITNVVTIGILADQRDAWRSEHRRKFSGEYYTRCKWRSSWWHAVDFVVIDEFASIVSIARLRSIGGGGVDTKCAWCYFDADEEYARPKCDTENWAIDQTRSYADSVSQRTSSVDQCAIDHSSDSDDDDRSATKRSKNWSNFNVGRENRHSRDGRKEAKETSSDGIESDAVNVDCFAR